MDRGYYSVAGGGILETFEGQRLLAFGRHFFIFFLVPRPVEKLFSFFMLFRVRVFVLDEVLCFRNLKVLLILLQS